MNEQTKSYENMTIEELKEQLEKEKLIKEINELKQANNNSTQAESTETNSEQDKKRKRDEAFQKVMDDMFSTESVKNSTSIRTATSVSASNSKKNNKVIHKGFCRPKCGSTNIVLIDNAVGGTKTTLNINPLHPLTVFKTKKKPKKVRSTGKTIAAIATGGASLLVTGGTKKKVTEEWYCQILWA